MYEVGVVGCGVVGARLADSFSEHGRTVVAAACDVVESKAESFAEEYDCAAFTDYREMIRDGDADVVYVGVPPEQHVEVVEFALERGKHVVCEKPIAEDAAAGERLVEAARESGLVTAVNLPFRHTPGFVEMRERVRDGRVGEPKRIELDFRFPQWPRPWQDAAWLNGREQGGPLREVGTHFLFGVQEMFGPIERVSAEVTYPAPDRCEDSIVGYFEVDGVHGTLDVLCGHAGSEENSVTVTGTAASLSLTEWYRLVENRGEDDETVLNETREETTLTLIDEFVARLDGEGGELVTFAEATRVQRVVDAIFDSEGATRELR